ncbi:Uncharacterised protein [uncultured archaeon]|nr:Uncharacterised protein [uncultured archaeon]
MLGKNSRIVIGAIIVLLLIVVVYVVAQPHVSQNQGLNSMDTATAQSGVSDGRVIPGSTAVATTQPAASNLPAQGQPPETENTTAIKIIAYKIAAYGNSPSAGFNFGSSSLDRYCVYKLQDENKNASIQTHAKYWMDYIAVTLEGMNNISEFEHRYNLTQSNCVERLTKITNNMTNTSNGSVENAEKGLVTVK